MGTSEKLAKNIKALLKSYEITPSQLSKGSGIDKPTISRILGGKTTNPQIETLKPIAAFFNVSIDQLIGLSPLPSEYIHGIVIPVKRLLVPVIDWKNVTYWQEIKDRFKPASTIEVNSHISPISFALKIINNKFEPRIAKGTIIIVDPAASTNNRDYVIVEEPDKIGNDNYSSLTIKQLIIEVDKKFLKNVGGNFEMHPLTNQQKFFGVLIEAFITMESGINQYDP